MAIPIRLICILFVASFLFQCSSTPHYAHQKHFKSMKKIIAPEFLKKGDTLMIVAPASVLKSTDGIAGGVELAKDWGLEVIVGTHVFDSLGHFAGSDANRLSDLQTAFDNPSVKAIWMARGGYGTNRIVDEIDFSKFLKKPKWVIGFSDITVLHNHIHNLSVQTIHANMATGMDSLRDASAVESLRKAIFGEPLRYEIAPSEKNRFGKANGELVGGNLSILASLLGTPSDVDMQGKILFIEDVGEALYRIDRMMISLKRNGYFKHINGLIVGDFSNIVANEPEFGKTLEDIVLEAVDGRNIPILFNFPAGHLPKNNALILGKKISLEVNQKGGVVNFQN
jgi:muramoyltetrapeptide carboxypeptidase